MDLGYDERSALGRGANSLLRVAGGRTTFMGWWVGVGWHLRDFSSDCLHQIHWDGGCLQNNHQNESVANPQDRRQGPGVMPEPTGCS